MIGGLISKIEVHGCGINWKAIITSEEHFCKGMFNITKINKREHKSKEWNT